MKPREYGEQGTDDGRRRTEKPQLAPILPARPAAATKKGRKENGRKEYGEYGGQPPITEYRYR